MHSGFCVMSISLSRRSLLRAGTALTGLAMLPAALASSVRAASRRVEDLLARMSVEEKIGQLTLYPDSIRPTPMPINPDVTAREAARENQLAEIRAGRVGGLLGGTGVEKGRELQKAALQSRLGIPLIFGADIVHGLRTIFPIPLGLAASFEPDLARRTARAAAEEATAVGVHWAYAPMVDVARDQRWGRVAEGSGEDVYLTSLFAAAYVKGFQGDDLRSPRTMAACPKHFAGYGAVIGGMDYNATDLTERELRETHLPPFKAAFDAGALTTMAAFNDLDGVPASGNRRLLTEILRGEWGFKGFVVSDALSAEELVPHGYAASPSDAAAKALVAGLDMNMGEGLFKRELPARIADGTVAMATLDEAVRRVLTVKEAIGLFDDPYRSLDARREAREVRTREGLALAREAAVRSVVLLRNEGGILPLKPGARVALIGPLGDDDAHIDGPWAPWARKGEGVTLAQALRRELGPDRLTVIKGSDIDAPIVGGIDAAVAAARASDIVLLAVGEGQDMSGEAHSRTEIIVPAAQQALAEAVTAAGRPVAVILSTGRALALHGAIRDAGAILVGWFLGSESGNALADIVTGRRSPGGRLPVSFPQASGQQPYYYNHKPTGRPQRPGQDKKFKARYDEVTHAALYPFGFGLTYSSVEYGPVALDRPVLEWDGRVTLTATLRNTGGRAVEEVAQLYVRDVTAGITRPVQQLKGFRKLALAPGAVETVRFSLTRADLEFIQADLSSAAEPGEFLAWIAPSAAAGEPVRFTLSGA